MFAAPAAIAVSIAGSSLFARVMQRGRPWLARLELWGVGALGTFVELLLSSLALATAGAFTAKALFAVSFLYAAAMFAWWKWGKGVTEYAAPGPGRGWNIALALVFAGAVASWWGASEHILGGQDSGVYVNVAGNIARQGTIYSTDQAVAALGENLSYALVPRDVLWMPVNGMVVDLKTPGRSNPQLLHGFSALLA